MQTKPANKHVLELPQKTRKIIEGFCQLFSSSRRHITGTRRRKMKTESYLVIYPINFSKKSVTDYVIRTETILTALRNAGQSVDGALIVAMILKGLPRQFDPFYIDVTHNNKELMFSEFKTELHSYEETLRHRDHFSSDNFRKLTSSFSKALKNESRDRRNVSCFTCKEKGHRTKNLSQQQQQQKETMVKLL